MNLLNINRATVTNVFSAVNNNTTQCENYITNDQTSIDFNAAKNQYISQKQITDVADYNTPEIKAFFNESVLLEKNIKLHNKYLKDGYFSSVSIGTLKNTSSDTIQKIAIKTLKKLNEIPKDYQVIPVDISFLYEVKSLLKLKKQDNIVQIIAATKNTTEGIYRIILELGNISLDAYNEKFVSDKPNIFLTNDNLACILRDTLLAIRACINFNIHHLDIHSGNLLIFFQQQKIKLSDFGMLAIDYHATQAPLNMKTQVLFCLCECIIANIKNNYILNEELNFIQTKVIQQLQKNNLEVNKENIYYQLQIEYKDKILEYAQSNKFIEYFLCFKYFHDIMTLDNIEKIISLIEDKFSCKFLTEQVVK